jgi:hypothetical protein
MFNLDIGNSMINKTQSSECIVVTKKKPPLTCVRAVVLSSGRQDSNLRSPGPKPGALTGLGHAPSVKSGCKDT